MSYSNFSLEEVMRVPHIDTNLFKLLLHTGNSILDLQVGIVSKIYGSDVIAKEETFALSEIQDIRSLQRHPLYKDLPLEAYIGSPIFFDGKKWATINFSSSQCRATDIYHAEIEFVDACAGIIPDSLCKYI